MMSSSKNNWGGLSGAGQCRQIRQKRKMDYAAQLAASAHSQVKTGPHAKFNNDCELPRLSTSSPLPSGNLLL
jgi:hypothetical protein